MSKEIKTNEAPAAIGLLSQAIESDGLVFVSGQIHLSSDGDLVGETIEEKTVQVMGNLEAILEAAGLTFSDVLKTTVYLTDMSDYAFFNKTYISYFEKPLPAREVVCVKELPLNATLEISLIARKNS